ncbi:hypothetical protein [Streptomyces sp. A30]|uniref:hypothetical protein n=1 Tax=Streptomyces sp. A30 TaxID=2789273 RepID=UPI003980B62D
MASGTDADILDKISELKDEISSVKTTLNTHARPENNVTNAELNTAKEELKEKIKAGKDEQKTRWEAFMEAIGFKNFFEAFKQLDKVTIAIVLIGAALVLLKDRVLNYGKLLNLMVEKITKKITGTGQIYSIDQRTGRPARRTREETDADQAVAINPRGLTAELLNRLTTALRDLSPEIRAFNSATGEMKSAATINKMAKAIGNLKEKLAPTNPANDIRETAAAIGELNSKMTHYDPEKLPKPQAFKKIADAAKDLNRDAGTLRQTFLELATASNTAAGAIGGGATAPAAR